MKRLAFVLAALMITCCLAACSSSQGQKTGGSQQIANPMEESTQQGIVEATGIDLPAPEGATDVKYFIYKVENPIAEMRFTLDGKQANLRAQATSLTDLAIDTSKAKSDQATYADIDISGMNYTWDTIGTQIVKDRSALCFVAGKVGFIAWIDAVPGILYNLSMDDGASFETLVQMADASFVPLQGDVA
ncbi:MAG: hypothetical protein Q4D34_00715 [Eggerthellaceae bacterium]|nr:hypothetical protein [Eggerthellaceae bacterium]